MYTIQEWNVSKPNEAYCQEKSLTTLFLIFPQHETRDPSTLKKYSKQLDELHINFCRRFSNFEEIYESLSISSCPLTQDLERTPEKL